MSPPFTVALIPTGLAPAAQRTSGDSVAAGIGIVRYTGPEQGGS
jgi:hypothetical protein